MKITFEEYLDSYKNEPDWMPRPTLEEYEKIQEECLLAEFLGYKEYPNTVLHRWDEQGEVWYEQMFEYGLYLTYDPIQTNRKVFEGNDELIIGSMYWLDWNNLMMVVDKLRSYSAYNNMEEGSIAIERFEISKNAMILNYSKRQDDKTRIGTSYHAFVEGNIGASDCESFVEVVYKTCLDFIKFKND